MSDDPRIQAFSLKPQPRLWFVASWPTWLAEVIVLGIAEISLLGFSRDIFSGILSGIAVLLSFGFSQVADRLAESQKAQVTVTCWKRFRRYFVLAQIAWGTVFFLSGNWAGFAGALAFLLYPLWRKLYRCWRPKDRHLYNVISIANRRPVWGNSTARCGYCGVRWVVTWPVGAAEAKNYGFECVGCGQHAGIEIQRHTPEE